MIHSVSLDTVRFQVNVKVTPVASIILGKAVYKYVINQSVVINRIRVLTRFLECTKTYFSNLICALTCFFFQLRHYFLHIIFRQVVTGELPLAKNSHPRIAKIFLLRQF